MAILNKQDNFRNWLSEQIEGPFKYKDSKSLILWYDPDKEWKDILLTLSTEGYCKLWAKEEHELKLRDLFFNIHKKPKEKQYVQ